LINAYRHCRGACELSQTLGAEKARKIEECHEKYAEGSSPPGDIGDPIDNSDIDQFTDRRNNEVGNQLGQNLNGNNCNNACLDAMESGKIRIRRTKSKP